MFLFLKGCREEDKVCKTVSRIQRLRGKHASLVARILFIDLLSFLILALLSLTYLRVFQGDTSLRGAFPKVSQFLVPNISIFSYKIYFRKHHARFKPLALQEERKQSTLCANYPSTYSMKRFSLCFSFLSVLLLFPLLFAFLGHCTCVFRKIREFCRFVLWYGKEDWHLKILVRAFEKKVYCVYY